MLHRLLKHSLILLSALSLAGFLYIYLKADINYYLNQELMPLAIPNEFFNVSEKLLAVTDNYKYLFWPIQIDSRVFSWTGSRAVGDFLSTSRNNLIGFSTANIKTKNYLSFIKTQIGQHRYWYKFINFLGVKYFFLRHDSVELNQAEQTKQLNYLRAQSEIEFKNRNGLITNFELKSASDLFYITDNYFLVVGGLEALEVLNSRDDFGPASNALVFTNQKIPLTKDNIDMIKNAKGIIFYRSQPIDLTFSLIPDRYWLWPANFTNSSSEEWQQASTSDPLHGEWHQILETETGLNDWNFDYGHNLVYARSESTLTVPFNINSSAVYEIFIRYFKQPKGNNFKLILDQTETTINSQAVGQQAGFTWQKISEQQLSKGNYKITLYNKQGFNAINALVIIPKNKLTDITNKVQNLLTRSQLIYLDKISQTSLGLNLDLPTFLPGTSELEVYLPDKKQSMSNWQVYNKEYSQTISWQLPDKITSILSTQNLSNLDAEGQSVTNQSDQTVMVSIPANSLTSAHRLASNLIKIEPKNDLFIKFKLTGENLNNLTARIIFYEPNQSGQAVSLTVTEIMGEKRGNLNDSIIEESFNTPAGAEWLRLEFKADKPFIDSKYYVSNLLLDKTDKLIPLSYIALLPANFTFASANNKDNNLSYQKINSTEYQLEIKPLLKPKFLIFSQSFDSYWQLTKNKKLISQPLPAYSLLNGFYLTPAKEQSLTLKFKPQPWFNQGLLVSAATIATCLLVIIFRRIAKQKNKIIDEI